MLGWWRRTVARWKAAARRKNKRRHDRRHNDWDPRYGDPFDGDF